MISKSGVRKWLFVAPLLVTAGVVVAASRPSPDVTPTPSAPLVATTNVVETDDFAASNCTYYSNASLTTIVGRFGYDCCNNPVAWGKKSAYKVCGGCFPCVPPPP
jgi:hypothetical protein